jgi:hypothetical protein
LQPNVIAVLSVVPRPHIGSKIDIGPLTARFSNASVTLLNNRVNLLVGFARILRNSHKIIIEEVRCLDLDRL